MEDCVSRTLSGTVAEEIALAVVAEPSPRFIFRKAGRGRDGLFESVNEEFFCEALPNSELLVFPGVLWELPCVGDGFTVNVSAFFNDFRGVDEGLEIMVTRAWFLETKVACNLKI
jgi:hypothetical protein